MLLHSHESSHIYIKVSCPSIEILIVKYKPFYNYIQCSQVPIKHSLIHIQICFSINIKALTFL